MRVAFLVTEFPSLSQVPVLNQIIGVIKEGYEVEIYPRKKGRLDIVHGDVRRYGLLERTRMPVEPPVNFVRRVAKALQILARSTPDARRVLLRTLDTRRFGTRALQLLQFFEVLPGVDSKPYDVIHCQFGTNALRGIRMVDVGALEGPLVTSFRGYDVMTTPQLRGRDVYRDLFSRGACFTSNTEFLAGKLAELGCPREKLVVLHSAHANGDAPFRERRLGSGERVEFVTVARLEEVKGIQYAIRAVARVCRQFPNIRYRVVGDGPLREDLQREIRECGVEKYIELLGWRSQEAVRAIYDESHVFLMPGIVDSRGTVEAQGIVLQEAQAMGLPVIASRVGGMPEGVAEGESALLVPEKDVDALAAAMEQLIRDSDEWPKMSRAGRQFVEERFGGERLTAQLMEVYARAMHTKPALT